MKRHRQMQLPLGPAAQPRKRETLLAWEAARLLRWCGLRVYRAGDAVAIVEGERMHVRSMIALARTAGMAR